MFQNAFNVHDGMIAAMDNWGPFHRLKKRNEATPLSDEELVRHAPELAYWSDVIWILWADQCKQAGKSEGSLKYVFRHSVMTPFTMRVMEAIINVRKGEYHDPWPGSTAYPSYGKAGNPFKALLGTPHGSGVVRLITDHLHALGSKSIESVTMFTTDENDRMDVSEPEADNFSKFQYNLLFTLGG